MDETYVTLIITIISLLFSAFFSGIEIAYVSSNKVRIELDVKQKGIISHILNIFYKNEEMFISTTLVGNNIALVVYGIGMAILLEPFIAKVYNNEAFVLVCQTIISTIIILFTAEFLPKTIFRINPNLSLRYFAVPMYLIYIILYPLSKFASVLSKGILHMAGIKLVSQQLGALLTRDELDDFIQQSIDKQDDKKPVENEVKIFRNALDFSHTHLRECMIPRNEIVAIDIDKVTTEELNTLFTESGRSKILVYNDSIDNILGYVHVSEMLTHPNDWQNHLKPVLYAPETMLANKMMRTLMSKKMSIVIVVDEYGGTGGMATLEDMVEEIFGDIEDEHDRHQMIERKLDDTTYEFSGRLEIEYLNSKYGLGLPENDDYLTIAGYIIYNHEALPRQGETLSIDNATYTILKGSTSKIELIRMTIDEQKVKNL